VPKRQHEMLKIGSEATGAILTLHPIREVATKWFPNECSALVMFVIDDANKIEVNTMQLRFYSTT
jgi:hypothetical protein